MKLKAMVIDDSRVMRSIVMNSLQKTTLAEFEFTEAQDGSDALGKFNPGDTDIVFVDWNMPKMSGIDFVRKVRGMQSAGQIPIVMVTSEKTIWKIKYALNVAGVNSYICKPFTVDDMKRQLGKLIEEISNSIQKPAEAAAEKGTEVKFSDVLADSVKQSLKDTFSSMCGIVLEAQDGTEEKWEPFEGITGIVAFEGGGTWSLILGLPQDTAGAVVEKFAGTQIAFDSEDMEDVVGELTNVLSGDVSARLDARGVKTQISVPKVVRYSKAGVPKEGQQSILCMKFASSDGKFWLKLAAVKEG